MEAADSVIRAIPGETPVPIPAGKIGDLLAMTKALGLPDARFDRSRIIGEVKFSAAISPRSARL